MFDVLHAASSDGDPDGPPPLIFAAAFAFIAITCPVPVTVGILITAGIVSHYVSEFRAHRKWRGLDSWPVTDATVESGFVQEVRQRRQPIQYRAELAYSYSVQGQYHSGLCSRRFGAESAAYEFAEKFRGTTLTVRYKPADHTISLMEPAQFIHRT